MIPALCDGLIYCLHHFLALLCFFLLGIAFFKQTGYYCWRIPDTTFQWIFCAFHWLEKLEKDGMGKRICFKKHMTAFLLYVLFRILKQQKAQKRILLKYWCTEKYIVKYGIITHQLPHQQFMESQMAMPTWPIKITFQVDVHRLVGPCSPPETKCDSRAWLESDSGNMSMFQWVSMSKGKMLESTITHAATLPLDWSNPGCAHTVRPFHSSCIFSIVGTLYEYTTHYAYSTFYVFLCLDLVKILLLLLLLSIQLCCI